MNILMVVGMTHSAATANPGWLDSCALLLFIAGSVSLATGAYLLYKAPKFQEVRILRRRQTTQF
jgi:hypothetical protein